MQMTRELANTLSKNAVDALAAVGKNYGVKFLDNGWTFDPRGTSVVLKIEAALLNADGEAETKERTCYKTFCTNLEMKPEWLDKTFKFSGDEYQIVGLNTRRGKRPVLAKSARNGKTYVFSPFDVALIMKGQEAAATIKT